MGNSYLQVENLTKSFGADVLFTGITFGLDEGDKVGLIAKNGTGKSTLLNIIAGDEGFSQWHQCGLFAADAVVRLLGHGDRHLS